MALQRKNNNFGLYANKIPVEGGTIQEALNELKDHEVLHVNDGFNVYSYERINGKIIKHAGESSVIDSLDSNSTTDALSANQGKILNKKIEDLNGLTFTIKTNPQPVIHNKGYKPSVTIMDKDGNVVICDITHISNNSFYIKWKNMNLIDGTIYII